ncbi:MULTISPECIES: IS200/IS605 family accessory protein TnpB-related protein [unclassified Streptomyces]|uniref:IS200/IS605 family accessory protein TnpB-related protein n=1 Tax=unclassified Streptomyces TaxID=2593676 RepID=UPI002E134F9A|nr:MULTISPECIES: IS200/IS605 family accessory protein TnpB-related protein [unclassified Streptomyces]WSJ38029.1 IS200/IS605 family accessory protein TnpB-related protein [Streptomyces sp. NBC_01321]WSP64430.1 IS200/IS605 family accessory protein TnpB-related protein [Streptomyces sp. NBC_01240]
MGGVRELAAPFVAPGPCGVAVRDRLKHLTPQDEKVLRAVGEHQGALASRDLRARCADGLEHSKETWAARKRDLTPLSSSRIAGAITKATHDQWALARRCQAAHIRSLEAGIGTLRHRLSLPVGARGTKRAAGGYRSKGEWFRKSRRLAALEARHAAAVRDRQAGRVRVVRGGRRLLNTRHHLTQARLTEEQWRERWEAERWFIAADGESGKRFGNETIRVTPDGEVSIKLPAPLAHLANAKHGRYTLTTRIGFAHRGQEWADRVTANRAVAYRIHLDVDRGRWYLTASWQRPAVKTIPLETARARGMIGVDTNADHFAAYHLDPHGNPIGNPHRFGYDLSGTTTHRDAQIRHALTQLLHWAKQAGVAAIAIEDLDFATEKTREKHGRKKRFRQLISGIPTGKLKARLVSMAAEQGLSVVAVDPAYTSMWGAQHWQKPLATPHRRMSRHDAAGIAIGRRALGHPVRRRTAPPPHDRRDRAGHRTAQAGPGARGRDGTRPPATDHAPGDVPPNGTRKRGPSASNTVRDAPSTHQWVQDSLMHTG